MQENESYPYGDAAEEWLRKRNNGSLEPAPPIGNFKDIKVTRRTFGKLGIASSVIFLTSIAAHNDNIEEASGEAAEKFSPPLPQDYAYARSLNSLLKRQRPFDLDQQTRDEVNKIISMQNLYNNERKRISKKKNRFWTPLLLGSLLTTFASVIGVAFSSNTAENKNR